MKATEKEYIERSELQSKAFGKDHPAFFDGEDRAAWYEKCINETPAADVVEIVRCKNCKHATIYKCRNDPCYNLIICEYQIGTDDENFYCIYGEKRAEIKH